MDGFITIGTKLDTKQFDKQIADLERKTQELENELKVSGQVGYSSEDIRQVEIELEKTKNKLIRLRAEKQKLEQPQGLKELKTGIDNFGQGLQNAVQKASKLVLGIFGIRSAFMMMRRASSELAGYDDEYAANLEYIRYVLTQAIAPVLKGIVELAMRLLAYINAIAQAWFGVNLFERGSIDNFKAMKQGVGGVTDSVKELKKQLAGFDEINVLQEDGSVTTGGGGGGITLPMMDLANIENIELPEWVKWIMAHKGEVLGLITAIMALFAGTKIAMFIRSMTGAEGAVLGFNTQLGKMVAGAALAVGGLALIGTGASNLASNWQEMTTQEKLAQIALVALGGAMMTFGLMMMGVSGPVAAVTALVAILGALLIAEHKEKGNILDLKKAEEDLAEARKKLTQARSDYIDAVDRAEQAEIDLKNAQKGTETSLQDLLEQVKNGTLDYKEMDEGQRNLYRAYLNNKDAEEKLADATKNRTEATREDTIATWKNKLAIDANADAYDEYKNAVIEAWKSGELKADEARELIELSMQKMGMQAQQTFMEDIPDNIKQGLDPEKYQSVIQRLTNALTGGFENFFYTIQTWWNTLWSNMWSAIQNPGRAFQLGMNTLFGQAKGAIVYNGLPKLAVGGIINAPGRGVPLGRAIGGERGAERSNSINR